MGSEENGIEENEQSGMLTRRHFLGLGAIASCGIAAVLLMRKQRSSRVRIEDFDFELLEAVIEPIPSSKEGLFYSTKPVKGIPQSWVDKQGLDVLRYANYIQDLGLKNVTAYVVLYPHFKTRGRHRNSIPPRYMWRNIVPTLRVIDEIASQLKAKVKPFISVYYSPSYNRAVRGRSKSQKLTSRAVKFQFYDVEPATVARVARALRDSGNFKGGIGNYKTFTHIDTRGHNVDW